MITYYNEIDINAAEWLGNLCDVGHIAPGTIDTRSITDVQADDLAVYRRCHFFAGIGGWDLALQLAGWPSGREVWTGSCPCQPFSGAGKRRGEKDKRHLWPEFRRLIAECHPATIFGEQVASPLGRKWLAGVFADLEGLGYAVAGTDLCAASVNSPHIRQRLFWVGNRNSVDRRLPSKQRKEDFEARWSGKASGTGNGNSERHGSRWSGDVDSRQPFTSGEFDFLPCLDGKTRRTKSGLHPLAYGIPRRVAELRTRLPGVGIGTARAFRRIALKGFGNAIVPQVAAEFIAAYMECEK